MKTIGLFSALLLAILSCGCSNDNGNNRKDIGGEWKLVNVHGGIAGIDDDFSPGTITWNFNTSSHTVAVVNTNTDNSKEDLIATGNYDYTFSPNTTTPQSCSENIVIDGVNYGCYDISTQQLTLSQVEADGYAVTLIR